MALRHVHNRLCACILQTCRQRGVEGGRQKRFALHVSFCLRFTRAGLENFERQRNGHATDDSVGEAGVAARATSRSSYSAERPVCLWIHPRPIYDVAGVMLAVGWLAVLSRWQGAGRVRTSRSHITKV